MSTFQSINPASGETIDTYDAWDKEAIDSAMGRADSAFREWRRTSFEGRADLLRALADRLKSQKEAHAGLITREMGKIAKEAEGEVEKCAWVLEYYADNAASFLEPETLPSDGSHSGVVYRPLGPILAVMPWNFPFWQVFRFAAPALMAGNVALLKHAENVQGCAKAIESAFADAGFPEGAFQNMPVAVDAVEGIIADERTAGVTLTGSVGAGRKVAALAGKYLKPSVMELGGSDPYLILDDADLDLAVEQCVASRILNGGQSCIGAKRFIVTAPVYDTFVERFVDSLKSKTPGEDFGPIVRKDLRDELHRQVEKSVEAGASLACGGTIPEGPGFYYPATVLTGVKPGMPAYEEELFGPVAAVIRTENGGEAIRVANDTSYGLGAAVFSRDESFARDMAENELEAGACFVNGLVKSDPRLPFGGIKNSGYGRELAALGIREFVNAKTIWVK